MNGRTRVVVLAAGTAAVVVVSVVAFQVARNQFAQDSAEPPASSADPATVLAGPHVTFRSTARDSHYGALAAASLSDPAGRGPTSTCPASASTAIAAVVSA